MLDMNEAISRNILALRHSFWRDVRIVRMFRMFSGYFGTLLQHFGSQHLRKGIVEIKSRIY